MVAQFCGVLGSFWQARTHAMMQNRDHLCELPCNSLGNHFQHRKSATNKQQRKQ